MTESAKKVSASIRENASGILSLGEELWAMPEAGFREYRTAARLARELEALGAEVERGIAVTGLRASIGPAGAPEIILVADMDALPTPGAPGDLAHSCGHSVQMAVMISAFKALAELPHKEGFRLVFLGAPAEEYVDLDYRLGLRRSGAIRLFSGKQEFIRLGLFDRAIAVLKYHSMPDDPKRLATVNGELNGFMAKRATFLGKPAHAGAEPHRGVNALAAATLALAAINAQRDTFRDTDRVRVHPIIREGGSLVNIVPERSVIETYVRAASVDAILDAAAKVDRALASGAIALGARLRIEDLPGYQPLKTSPELGEALGRAALSHFNAQEVDFSDLSPASDDIGDVSSLAPTCHLSVSGFRGRIHAADFAVSDPERAYILPTLIVCETVCDLAEGACAKARAAAKAFKPRFSKDAYVKAVETLFSDRFIDWRPPSPE